LNIHKPLFNLLIGRSRKQLLNAMASASATERFALIKENLAEILDPQIIETILAEGRNPRIYWGMFVC
jgi:hypothetical protein